MMSKRKNFGRDGWQWYLVAAAMWALFAVLISYSDEVSALVSEEFSYQRQLVFLIGGFFDV